MYTWSQRSIMIDRAYENHLKPHLSFYTLVIYSRMPYFIDFTLLQFSKATRRSQHFINLPFQLRHTHVSLSFHVLNKMRRVETSTMHTSFSLKYHAKLELPQ